MGRRGVLARFVGAGALGLVGLAGAVGAAPVAAGDEWCVTDPPVLVTTPAGSNVVVFVVDAGPAAYRDLLKKPTIVVQATPVKGGTQVRLEVVFPVAPPAAAEPGGGAVDGSVVRYPVKSQVWSGQGSGSVLLSDVSGEAGAALVHRFWLPVR
jgi:hypothetical protein